ncbi:MAG: hypothetical protein IJS80_08015 [Lachnospiraceae bacterium]|nr:hypothetical protein [Lachnospiraceae bacterium]
MLFRSKEEKQLDALISSIEMNMANNYKDNAQSDFKEFEELLARFIEEGKLKEKARLLYERKLGEYKTRLKGYTHKDQKPYWAS